MGMATRRNKPGSKSVWNTVISWIFDNLAVRIGLFDMVFGVASIHDAL
jgi:uncharacterized membrane protein